MSDLRWQWRATTALTRRSVMHAFRQPHYIAPVIVLPTVMLAAYSGQASSAVKLDGFPQVDGFFDFVLAGAMILAAGLAAVSGGIALATDIELQFMHRVLTTPAPRSAIVLGRLAGTTAWGVIGGVWFLVVGLLFGAEVKSGPLGALVMLALVALTTLALATFIAGLALRSGQTSAVQGLFPLVIVLMLISSAFFPRDLLLEPAATIADGNPMSYVAEAIRDPWIGGMSGATIGQGLLAIAVVGAVGALICATALRQRTATT
jgi:ABC-2 type transport system permease protein